MSADDALEAADLLVQAAHEIQQGERKPALIIPGASAGAFLDYQEITPKDFRA